MAERPLFDPSLIRGAAPTPPPSSLTLLSPTQVNELVGGAVAKHLPPTLHVVAEIGDVSRAASGHYYLTLKDDRSELRGVMWRSAAMKLKFEPQTGLQVIATGAVEVYAARGTYQLMIRRLEPRGAGALDLAFRQLRDRLEREGLFDAARKRAIPRIPRRAAIITSEQGAALHDVLRVVKRRYRALDLVVVPTSVQGAQAAEQIAGAIARMNRSAEQLGGIDAAIVCRGGGSLEDLWAFNTEIVARAVASSAVPIVSGVGHETDVTICDLAADARAATPTAAAEMITPDAAELRTHLRREQARLVRAVGAAFSARVQQLGALTSRDVLRRPMQRVTPLMQRIDDQSARLRAAADGRIVVLRDRLRRGELAALRAAASTHFARAALGIEQRADRLRAVLGALLDRRRRENAVLTARAARALPAQCIGAGREFLAQIRVRMSLAASRAIASMRDAIAHRTAVVEAHNPRAVLQLGYSILRDADSGRIIRSVTQVLAGQRLQTELADGKVTSTADGPAAREKPDEPS